MIYISPILLLFWIFYMVTLQLGQLKHSDSYLRGRQQMFMGLLFMHWPTMWVKIELLGLVPSPEGCRVQGNTPDFMLKHFIVHPTDDIYKMDPSNREAESNSHCYSALHSTLNLNMKKNHAKILQWLDTCSIVKYLNYCSWALFHRTNTVCHTGGDLPWTNNGTVA